MAVPTKAMFIAILLAIFGAVAAKDIPEFLHICRMKDPNYDKCVTETIHFLRPYLKTGLPDYNIESIEPMKLHSLEASPMNSMKLQLHDATLNGISNFQIKSFKLYPKTLNMQAVVLVPYIAVEGMYDIDGKIFILPIKGSGPVHGNFSNCIANVDLLSDILTENDVQHFHIKEIRLKLTFGNSKLKLDNLLGDTTVGEVINEVINSNLDLFMQNIIPPVEKVVSGTFQRVANNIVMQFSLSQLFPDYTIP